MLAGAIPPQMDLRRKVNTAHWRAEQVAHAHSSLPNELGQDAMPSNRIHIRGGHRRSCPKDQERRVTVASTSGKLGGTHNLFDKLQAKCGK